MKRTLAVLLVVAAACSCSNSPGGGGGTEPTPDTGIPCPAGLCGGSTCCGEGQVCFDNQCCTPACAGKNCGSDGCGGSCGSCDPGWTCSPTFSRCECTPESAAALCQRLQKPCGSLTATDNCGASRTVDCDACQAPTHCDAAAQACVCDPEPLQDFCTRLGRACGPLTGTDTCGTQRTVDCGGCPGADQACNGQGQCMCVPETNGAFCTRVGRACGPVTAADNCGTTRTVSECGPCHGEGELCTRTGHCVVCTRELDTTFCDRLGKDCGTVTADDNCEVERIAECGTCSAPEVCDGSTNTCGMASNDTCAFPGIINIVLGTTTTVPVDTSFASDSGDGSCRPSSGNDLVYAFTLGSTTDLEITSTPASTTGQDVRPTLYLRTSCEQQGTELGCATIDFVGETTLSLEVLPAGQYFLWVDGYSPQAGNGPQTVAITAAATPAAPANDQCAAAQTLNFTGTTASVTGTTRGAIDDARGGCSAMPGGDVVYAFDLSEDSVVTATVTAVSPSTFEPALYIRTGCLASDTELACAAVSSGGAAGTASTTVRLAGGGHYLLFVDSVQKTRGSFTLDVVVNPALANDTCAHPEPLVFNAATNTASVVADTSGALDDMASGCNQYFTGNDIVFSYQLPPGPNQNVQIDVVPSAGSQLRPNVSVRSACDLGSSEVGCTAVMASVGPASLLVRNQAAPGTYYLWVDGSNTTSNGAFTLTVSHSDTPPGPPNDLCAGAILLPIDAATGLGSIAGTTVNALNDSTGSCEAMPGGDVVYQFELQNPAWVTAKVTRDAAAPTTFVPAVYIRSDCLSSALADQKACAAASALSPAGDGVATATVAVLPAGIYDLIVDSVSGEGAFTVDLAARAPVDNLSCATARALVPDPLTGSVTVLSDNSFGTDTIASSCNSYGTGSEVVFSFQVPPARNQDVTIALTPLPGSPMQPNPSVRTACSALSTEIACGLSPTASSGGAPTAVQLKLRNAVSGTYYLWVDSWSSSTVGPFSVTLSMADPAVAANDTCATAEALNPDSVTGIALVTATTDAALDDGNPSCKTGTGADLVYSLTTTQAQGLDITLTPSANPGLLPVLSVRSGCAPAGAELGCVAPTAFGTAATLSFPRLAAGTYYIFVDSASAATTGSFTLQVQVNASPQPPANDLCVNAALLTWDATNKATASGDTTNAFDDDRSGCATSSNALSGPDLVYQFVLGSASQVTARVTRDPANTTYKPAVSIRSGCTGGTAEEAVCGLDNGSGVATAIASLAGGTWYVFVDGIASTTAGSERGPFTLEITQSGTAIAADGCGNPDDLVLDATGTANVSSTTITATNSGDGSCRATTGNDRVYRLTLGQEKTVKLTLKPPTGVYNFIPNVYMRRECDVPSTEMVCAVGSSPAPGGISVTVNRVPAGTYYVWADAYHAVNNAAFQLKVETSTPTGTAPANDACAAAQVLTLDPISHGAHATGDTTWAANDYAGNCATATKPHSGGDVVYSVDVSAGMKLYAVVAKDATETATFYPAVYVRRGTCASSAPADEIACNAVPSTTGAAVTADITATGTYYVIVDGQSGSGGKFVLDVVARPAANANDTCAAAETITLDSNGWGMAAGSTVSLANGSYGTCAGNNAPNVVFSVTTGAIKDLAFDLTPGAMFTPALYVRSACADTATQKACDYKNAATPLHVAIPKLPAGTYYVWVDGYSFGSGTFALSVQASDPAPPPPHDTCRGAQALTFDSATSKATVTDSMANANPDYTGTCGAAGSALDGPDLVYTFSLGSTQQVTAKVTRAATSMGYKPAVYIRSGVCDSAALADEVACARDNGATSTAVATLTQGDYYVIVDGVSGTYGDFTLEVTKAAPILGDGCLVATPLVPNGSGVATLSGTTATATNAGDGTCSPYSGPDLVYTFTTITEQTVDIALQAATGSSYIPYFYLRTACNDPAASSEVFCKSTGVAGAPIYGKIPRLPAGTYYLWIDSYSGTSGAFTGTVTFTAVPPTPANDVCTGAELLGFTGGVATVNEETWFASDSGGGTCDLGVGPDLVYTFDLASASKITVEVTRDASSPSFEPVVYVRSACGSVSDLDELTCVKHNLGVARATINNAPQGTYWIWVDGGQDYATATPGKFTLQVTLSAAVTTGPANENCAAAQTISVTPGTPTTVTGTTVGAQNDTWTRCWSDESKLGSDVVYKLVTTADQKISAKLMPSPTFGGVVAIRRVCASALATDELACAGDCGPGTLSTAVVKYAPAGTYWIWVDAATTTAGAVNGAFSLEVRLDTALLPPANDTCARPTILTLGAAATAGDTSEARHDYGGAPWSAACASGYKPNGPEVVYQYTPSASGMFNVEMTPAGWDASLWYSTGICGGTDGSNCSQIVDAGGAGGAETITVNGVAGTTYYFYASSYALSVAGPFTIRVY